MNCANGQQSEWREGIRQRAKDAFAKAQQLARQEAEQGTGATDSKRDTTFSAYCPGREVLSVTMTQYFTSSDCGYPWWPYNYASADTCNTLYAQYPTSVTGCSGNGTCNFTCGDPCCDTNPGDGGLTGSSMAENCGISTEEFLLDEPPYQCSQGDQWPLCGYEVGSCPSDDSKWSGTFSCVKNGWDSAYLQQCCFGDMDDQLYCDPMWCISDPSGNCAEVFLEQCTGKSACGLHKFLTTNEEATNDVPCAQWYNYIRDLSYEYFMAGSASVPPPKLVDAVAGIDQEIQRFCTEEGASNGECTCYNAYTDCEGMMSQSLECMVGVPLGNSQGRKLDAYCDPTSLNPTNASYTSDNTGGAVNICDPSSSRSTLNRAPGTPYSYDPTTLPDYDTFGGMPVHCWHPYCQFTDEVGIFKKFADTLRPCPSICMQYSTGINVQLNWADAGWIEIADNSLMCSFNQQPATLETPFAFPDGCTSLNISLPPNYTATIPMSITNLSVETHLSYTTNNYSLFTSMVSVMGWEPSSGSVTATQWEPVTLTVDTSNMVPYSQYQGFGSVIDPTGANGSQQIPITLNILGYKDSPMLPTECSPDAQAAMLSGPQIGDRARELVGGSALQSQGSGSGSNSLPLMLSRRFAMMGLSAVVIAIVVAMLAWSSSRRR